MRINEAGKLILEICKEGNLFVANTMFDYKQIHMYMYANMAKGREKYHSFIIIGSAYSKKSYGYTSA